MALRRNIQRSELLLRSGASEISTVQHLMTFWGQYHNHKEQMAFATFGLEAAFFIGWFSLNAVPPALDALGRGGICAVLVATWVVFHAALRYQLRNRRISAVRVAACSDALTQRGIIRFNREQDFFVPPLALLLFIDAWIVPVRGAFRSADFDYPLSDGVPIRAQTLESYAYHLLKHKRASQESRTKYALPIEWLMTAGSIALLLLALSRALVPGATPPNPSIERTTSGALRAPPVAAHVER